MNVLRAHSSKVSIQPRLRHILKMEAAGDPYAQPAPVLCADEFFEEVSRGLRNLTSPMRLLFTPVVYGPVGKR